MASSHPMGTIPVNGGVTSLPILRETVNTVSEECPTRLGLTAEEIESKAPSLDDFFETIAAERLRRMPPDGSRLDGVLRRASRLAVAVGSLRDSVSSYMDGADEATALVWGTTLLLLEMGIDQIDIIESLFGRYGRITMGISLLLQQETYFPTSRPLQQQVAEIYAHILQLVVHVAWEYRQGAKTQHRQSMNAAIDMAFFRYFNRFATHWRRVSELVLQTGIAKHQTSVDLSVVYQFLELQDRPLQVLLEGHSHSLADGSFSWFEPHLTTFAMSRRSLMMIRGNPGSGKSALAQWTVERLQASSEYDIWNVVPIIIRSDVPITTLTLSILKGILIQILDHSVASRKTQDAILTAVTGAIELAVAGASDPQVEGQLWTAIRAAVQSNLHFMLVVDGFDQMKHAETTVSAFLGLLQDTVADTPSKLIIFSRPMSKELLPIRETTNTHQIAMNAATTQHDMQVAVNDMMMTESSFSGLESSQRESLGAAIVSRSQGCFIWAQLAVEAVQQRTTVSEMTSAVAKMPNTLGDLIDHHLRTTNIRREDAKNLLGWLAASERPLRIPEVEQLMAVDSKTLKVVSRSFSLERDLFQPLRRLVAVRDGFVSFRHPMIREHLQARAQMRQELPFSLADAHFDLLIRCLAWVRRTVTDEVSLAWDKMSVFVRDRYLDAYVLLEYTARYWLSHMLASPMASSDRELSFPETFRRALPDTVLFSQLELTNRESQFSRSSIVELYRLSVGVRRVVLGNESPALLQSLILSARAAEQTHASWANDHLYEAWMRSRSQLGPSNTITRDLEQMLIANGQADRTTGMKTEALKDMALSGWDSSDISFAQRLQYLDKLVTSYNANNQHDAAYSASKQFYRQTVQTYGNHSPETLAAAEYLTKHFDIAPPDEMALELARTKYEMMLHSMDATDPRRVAYSLYLAQLYEENNQVGKADTVLSRLWAGLSARGPDSTDSWDQKTRVAFYYSQFLRRQRRPDQATGILRDLSADLEAGGGVNSPQMVKRAEELRGEARQMNLKDMDRALALQMWKYYRSSGQQYTPQAVSLAESLTEGIIPTKGTADSLGSRLSTLSPEDNELLPGWIDTVASARSERDLMSILNLSHQLASQRMAAEKWREGSECAWAVLKHVWPTVEDPQSKARFPSEQAPLIASLALDHAYCLFRRLDVAMATIVYGNAFKASITADQVAVPSVTTVVKTVVEFYETTFQFDKAMMLLHQVSDFFASRLGSNDKHTLDSRYYEADLALRLDRRSEAEESYSQIYIACIPDGRVTSSGVRAAVALVTLYEQDKKWEHALDVYRHLWPTLVHFDERDGYDRALLEGLLPKTYSGYMSILENMSSTEAGYNERYQVASQHHQLCRKLYGPTSHRTRDATMTLAGICAANNQHRSEALQLYEQALKTDDWVPSAEASRSLPDMTQPLPMDIKHRMAQLFMLQKDTSPQARAFYTEELALSKQQQGLSAPTTHLWLREIARLYALQDNPESRRQGAEILHEHVDEVVHVTANHDALVERAHGLAEIYLECGYIDEGWALINELHQQVIHDTPASHRQNLAEYRPAAFVAAFEEVFGRTRSSRQILDDLSREGQVYNVFQQHLSGHDLMPTLAAGDKLHKLQTEQKRIAAAQDTQDKLYEFFCNTLSVAQPLRKKDIVHQFYIMCRRESQHEDYNINIVTQTTGLVRDLCNRSRFQDAADVTGVFHSFVHLTDGLRLSESIFTAIKLCLFLSGYQVNKCTDGAIAKNMSFESQMLLQEIMANARDLPMEYSELPFAELNDLVTVLGEHEMFEDLESILTDLWTSRIVQKTWSLPAVVWIGRRLVETRFCRGQATAATTLGKDICYNLRQVWGNADPVTLEMNKLLSGLYTASGNHLAAAALHETALAELLNSETSDHNAAVNAVTQHLELLQRAQGRLVREGQSAAIDATAAQERVQDIATKFGLSPTKLEAGSKSDESMGMWQRPRRFSLDVEELETHQNHLRQSSGSALLTGNGGAKRLSITAL